MAQAEIASDLWTAALMQDRFKVSVRSAVGRGEERAAEYDYADLCVDLAYAYLCHPALRMALNLNGGGGRRKPVVWAHSR
jgi:hypothetical protein